MPEAKIFAELKHAQAVALGALLKQNFQRAVLNRIHFHPGDRGRGPPTAL
jgi:hypothetical protein